MWGGGGDILAKLVFSLLKSALSWGSTLQRLPSPPSGLPPCHFWLGCVFLPAPGLLPPGQGVEELSRLLKKAEVYYEGTKRERPPPDRLPYVHSPRNAGEADHARLVARAVGDAQVSEFEGWKRGVRRRGLPATDIFFLSRVQGAPAVCTLDLVVLPAWLSFVFCILPCMVSLLVGTHTLLEHFLCPSVPLCPTH